MKYILIVPDGMADYPLTELNNQTPWQVAKTPNFDLLAKEGRLGIAQTIPEGVSPGSDVAILSILGYDPRKYYTGRGPIEAVALKVSLSPKDVAFRCNLITSDGNNLIDYSAGHISTEDAWTLMKKVADKLETEEIKFYPGVSYRHLMVWKGGPEDIICTPPHDIRGKRIKEHLPKGEREKVLHQIIWNSIEILDKDDLNKKRQGEGKAPANMLWPWGGGKKVKFPQFEEKYKIKGRVISAVDLVKGIGLCAGLEVIDVPGATGYYDTNYQAKAEYALIALEELDFVFVHIEAPDEAGHNADISAKISAIENVDKKVLQIILEGVKYLKEGYKILLLPDHFTPISIRTHSREAVPFCLYSTKEEKGKKMGMVEGKGMPFNESLTKESHLEALEGYKLMDLLIEGENKDEESFSNHFNHPLRNKPPF